MAQETFTATWNKLLLRCPELSPKLAQDFIVNAFRRLIEHRRWSWQVRFGQFIAPNAYNTGTVALTQGFTTITGTGTAWTAALVGQQFRVGLAAPIYTIAQFDSPTQMELDQVWGGPTSTGSGYSIYQCFYTPPSDFHQFITLWDVQFNWSLSLDIDQSEINAIDAQRANTGNAYMVSFRGYNTSQVGIVGAPLQVQGSGPSPTSGGVFLGPSNAIFTIQITTGGTSGTAVFEWKKNNGAYTTAVLTDAGAAPQTLMDGVVVSFPLGLTYVLNDTFVVQATAVPNAGLPFYELYPHQQAQHIYSFLYEAVPPDLNDPGAVIPLYIRSNFLVDLALEDLASWPGVSADKTNMYFSLRTAQYYKSRNAEQLALLELQDDNVWTQNISYSYPALYWPFANVLGDSRFLQSHAL
jgi:hypothetical protein